MTRAPADLTHTLKMKAGKQAGIVGIAANLVLFVGKIILGLITGSIAIIGDAINNISDACSSVLVLIGYVCAAKPADKEHPYGHARMEYLCSLIISIIITVLGLELFTNAVKTLLHPGDTVQYSPVVLVIMFAAILVKSGLALYYHHVGKKINSASLRASAVDSIRDVCATAAVIIGIFLTPVFGPRTDGVLGLGIAVYILVMGIMLIKDSVNTLLGTAPDTELVKKIITRLKSYDGVLGIHDLVIHNYGVDRYFATVHLEMAADRDIMQSHDIIDNIEVDFSENMGIQMVIHFDPICQNDERTNDLRNKVQSIIAEVAAEFSSPISMHDFRAVFGHTHTNLIFDVAVSHEMPLTDKELVLQLRSEIRRQLGEHYNSMITIDRDYTTNRY